MQVGVAYADVNQQVWLKLDVPEGSTVREAIEKSGILKRITSIDLTKYKVGIYGKITRLDAVVKEHDRIEIYRGITAKPVKSADDDDDDD